MKRNRVQSTVSAAKMMCPYRFAQVRPLKSIVYLVCGLMIVVLDCSFSKRILRFCAYDEFGFVILLAVSGFSVLMDVVSMKRSFAAERADILSRFSSVATSMLFTAAAFLISPYFIKYQVWIVLICSLVRLCSPPTKKPYVFLLVGVAALVAAIVVTKTVYGETDGVETVDSVIKNVCPVFTTLITKIKDFIVSRW